MNNKMLHRGSMARLTSTGNNFPVLSTCILLLIHFQIFHALPTSSSSFSSSTGSQLPQNTVTIIKATSGSFADNSAYPYSSYRPGARLDDSYRPYRVHSKDSSIYPISDVRVPEPSHPNSVYSGQQSSSSAAKNLDKALQLIEKEIQAGSDLQQQQKGNETPFSDDSSIASLDASSTPGQKQISSPLINKKSHNNKPRLVPLPSVELSASGTAAEYESNNYRKSEQQQQPQHNDNNKDQAQQQQQTNHQSTLPSTNAASSSTNEQRPISVVDFSPIPPPFAPELDPQYERRQYGLGALSLLDQAGSFW